MDDCHRGWQMRMLNKQDINSIGLALAPLFAREMPSKGTSTQTRFRRCPAPVLVRVTPEQSVTLPRFRSFSDKARQLLS